MGIAGPILKRQSSPIWKKPYKFFGMRFGVSKREIAMGIAGPILKRQSSPKKVVRRRLDLNQRPLLPQSSALTGLRHAP